MKRALYIIAIAATALSCVKESTPADNTLPAETFGGRVITVSPIASKTAISEKQEGGYTFTWKAGDQIALYEFVYENRGSEVENATPAYVFYSEALKQDAAAATFTVDLNTTLSNPGGGKYRYVAVSPSNADY